MKIEDGYAPVQDWERRGDERRVIPVEVHMRAYEVYVELYGEQKALVTGECRGGFGTTELIAFLYARSFPKEEWRSRFEEAIRKPEAK